MAKGEYKNRNTYNNLRKNLRVLKDKQLISITRGEAFPIDILPPISYKDLYKFDEQFIKRIETENIIFKALEKKK